MKSDDFIEASAYIRVLEKRMLNNAGLNRLIEAPNTLETLRLLSQNCEYDFTSLKRQEDYEGILKTGLQALYNMMYKLSKHREIVDIAAAKYDFHNLKVYFKSKYLGKDMSYLYSDISSLDMSKIETKDTLPFHITKAMEDVETAYNETGDPQDIDIILDKAMFAHMLSLCGKTKNDFITEYVQLSIDFYNIKTLMRIKNMQKGTRFLNTCFVPKGLTNVAFFLENYDKTPETIASIFYYKYFGDVVKKGMEEYAKIGNFGALEKLFDNYLIDYVKKAKYSAYGAEVLFAYIMSKENEIRQIRILVTGKSNNIQTDTLKERLRDNYA